MEVVTFYSYKGGVGRTLLLAWVARALAASGKRVLALDLDLEAPGLPTKLRPMSESRAGYGLVDLLLRFQGGASPPTDLAQWCLPVATKRGSLWLLPAGAAPSPAYWQALSRISWESLFAERAADGARFFLWLRDALAKSVGADFLLIDARTGVTEMGAAAVGLLADTVVAVTNTSPESKTGLREVLRAAVGSPRVGNRPPLRILPVLSRVPALLGADDDARLVDQLQRFLNEEADPLTSTLAVEHVLAIHHEEALLEDEQRAFLGPPLRVIADYERVLAWLIREAVPGPNVNLSLPRSSHLVEAIRAQEKIIAAYRESAAINPDTYTPMLADALASIARNLAQLGRREEALAAAEEVVALHRGMVRHRPNIHLSTLAGNLRILGLIQSELGRRDDALASIEEVVAIRRELAQQRPAEFLPDLAESLSELGSRLSELGRREEALASTEEAVVIYRELTKQWPVFLPDLARSLQRLGDRQNDLGRYEEALTFMEEAVAHHRELVKQGLDLFLRDLVRSLNKLGIMQGQLGRYEEALAAATEAVVHYKDLAMKRPDALQPNLAEILTNLGVWQAQLGQREEALISMGGAVELYLLLFQGRPEVFSQHARGSFRNYLRQLQDLGRSPDMDPLAVRAREILGDPQS